MMCVISPLNVCICLQTVQITDIYDDRNILPALIQCAAPRMPQRLTKETQVQTLRLTKETQCQTLRLTRATQVHNAHWMGALQNDTAFSAHIVQPAILFLRCKLWQQFLLQQHVLHDLHQLPVYMRIIYTVLLCTYNRNTLRIFVKLLKYINQ